MSISLKYASFLYQQEVKILLELKEKLRIAERHSTLDEYAEQIMPLCSAIYWQEKEVEKRLAGALSENNRENI